VTSDKAIGSNRLLREGAALVRGPEDVLDELFGVGRWAQPKLPRPPDPARELEPGLRRVLEAVEDGEDIEGIARMSGLAPAAARAALGRLETDGLVARTGVGAFERTLGP
jgi:DNA processing protein